MRYRIEVDREVCAGSAICAGIAPRHLEMGADHIARAVEEVIDADDAVIEAALNCPVDAIVVLDADTGETLPPG